MSEIENKYNTKDSNRSQFFTVNKLTISAIVIALYCVIMYFTGSFSFGPYQIRIATSLYAFAYLYPFLVVPLGIANFLSNMLGGLGIIDMVGGCIVGIITAFIITIIRKYKLPLWLCAIPIIIIPGTIVPIWLSILYSLPYGMLVVSLCMGQVIPSIVGVILIKILGKVLK